MRFTSKRLNILEPGKDALIRVELCAHTGYSMRKGIGSPTEVVKAAKELGISALAICDDYSTAGYTEFYRACKTAQIDAIYGATIRISKINVVLLAKNRLGVKAINEIITRSTPNNDSLICENKMEDLEDYKENIITIGIIPEGKSEGADSVWQNCDYFGVTTDMEWGFNKGDKQNESLLKKTVVVSNSYYLSKSDKLLHDAISGRYTKHYSLLRNGHDLLNRFPREIVFDSPLQIINEIEDDAFKGPADHYDFPHLISKEDFRKLVSDEISNKKEFENEDYITRLNLELDGVVTNDYWNIYYLAYRLVNHVHEKGEIVGLRGSGNSSLLAYAIGITDIDPIKWNIPYQTFLGFYAEKVPDFDFNISEEMSQTIFDFLSELVGKDNIVRAGTLYKTTDYESSVLVTNYLGKKDGLTYYYENSEETKIFKLGNTTINIGCHPGGYFLKSDSEDYFSYTPIKFIKDQPVTLTDFHDMHDAFLKLDVLPYAEITFLLALEKATGVKLSDIPLDDEKVLSLLKNDKALEKNKTVNTDANPFECVAEFGSQYVHELIKKTKPTTIEDMIKIAGFSHGTCVWNENGELLFRKGYQIKDLIANRDDVYTMLTEKYDLDSASAFDIMENVRKGRGLRELDIVKLKEHNVPDYLMWSMDRIKYAFPKSHSVSYVILALKEAYYKVYYPLEFYNCYFNLKAKKAILESITKLTQEEVMDKINKNAFNAEELKLISNMYDMMERGFTFKPNEEEIIIVKGEVDYGIN